MYRARVRNKLSPSVSPFNYMSDRVLYAINYELTTRVSLTSYVARLTSAVYAAFFWHFLTFFFSSMHSYVTSDSQQRDVYSGPVNDLIFATPITGRSLHTIWG